MKIILFNNELSKKIKGKKKEHDEVDDFLLKQEQKQE